MKKLIGSKAALVSAIAGAAVLMACASDADIARVQGNQNTGDAGTSGSTSSSSTSSSSSSSSGAPDSGPDATAACNSVAQEGPGTTLMYKHMPAPVAAGGSIADGVYVITADTVYDDFQMTFPYDTPMNANQRWTMEVQGGTIRRNVGEHHQNIATGAGSVSTKYTSTIVCDDQSPGAPFPPVEGDYTATPTTFTEFVYSQGGGGNPIAEVYTWTKIR